jgi:S1-C subfamily serine protease
MSQIGSRQAGFFGPADPTHTVRLRMQILSLLALLWMPSLTSAERTLGVEELVLRAKPAVVLVTTRVNAEVTLDCGDGPITVSPAPYQETGTAWFVDGRGYLITNAHVVDPAYRSLPWVIDELKSRAVDQGCLDPALAREGLVHGQRLDREAQIRHGVDTTRITVTRRPEVTVLLSNGTTLPAEIQKFSPPLLLYASGEPTPDSGRDLALLRVGDGVYPALGLSERNPRIGQPVRILGFPGVMLSERLLNESARLEASVTTGTISGFKQDVIGQDVIQTDAPAAPGHSGGPAVGPHGTVIGVLTSISLSGTGLVQGFNFLVPARDINNFLRGTEISRPGESRFNLLWAAGLSDLRDEHFTRAAAHFVEANALLPGLVDVKRALAEADDAINQPRPRPSPWVWLTVGVGLVSLGAYGVLWHGHCGTTSRGAPTRSWRSPRPRRSQFERRHRCAPCAEPGSVAGTGRVERVVARGVEPAVVEALDVGKDLARQVLAARFLGAERRAKRGGQLFEDGGLVDPGEAASFEHHLARHHHGVDGRGPRAVHHGIHRGGVRGEVGRGHARPGHRHEIGRPAGFEDTDAVAKPGRCGPTGRRHPEDLGTRGDHVLHSGHAVQPEDEAHLLEHVPIVVDAGLVEAKPHPHAARGELVERRHAAPEAQVGAGIVADHGAALRSQIDVVLAEPHAVPQGQLGTEQSELVEVPECRGPRAAARVLLLVSGFHQMHVERHRVLPRVVAKALERLVRAPVQVRGRELDAHPLARVAAVALPQVDE